MGWCQRVWHRGPGVRGHRCGQRGCVIEWLESLKDGSFLRLHLRLRELLMSCVREVVNAAHAMLRQFLVCLVFSAGRCVAGGVHLTQHGMWTPQEQKISPLKKKKKKKKKKS